MGGRSFGASWITVRPLKTVKREGGGVLIILRVTRMTQAVCDTWAVTGWGNNPETEFSMQDVSDPSGSTAVERRGGKQEWAEGEVQL